MRCAFPWVRLPLSRSMKRQSVPKWYFLMASISVIPARNVTTNGASNRQLWVAAHQVATTWTIRLKWKMENGKPVKDPAMKIRYFKKAYHDMCIGCHKEIKKKNKALEASKASLGEKLAPTGPTGCNQCHPKE